MRLEEKLWYGQGHWYWLLAPLTGIFILLSGFRRVLFRLGLQKSEKLDCTVIVVGNINVGGTGKTPLILALIERLSANGLKVGVISRGYGGHAAQYPYTLDADSTAAEAGDEPLMIFKRTGVPMVVGPDRVAAGKALLSQHSLDLILCDDGLQHYRLKRDIEMVVIDGKRRFGNGCRLPMGPLREPVSRLKQTDLLVANGVASHGEHLMLLKPSGIYRLNDEKRVAADQLEQKLHAIAGIGNPQRFFDTLMELGITTEACHAFVDHHKFSKDNIDSRTGRVPLIMTEKDAIKCRDFARPDWYYLRIDASLPDAFWISLGQMLPQQPNLLPMKES